MQCSKVKIFLKDVLLIPMTVGHAENAGHHPLFASQRQDGSISSLVLGTTVVAIVSVLMLISHTNRSLTTEKAEGTIRITSMLVLIIGICSLAVVIYYGRSKGRLTFRKHQQTTFLRTKLGFLWLFAAGFLLHAIVFIIDTIQTRDTDFTDFLWVVRLLWNILLVIFVLMQSVFISLSGYLCVEENIHLQYGLNLQLAANVLIWITAIIKETPELHPNSNRENLTDTRNRTAKRTGFTNVIENDISPYTIPMATEFILLCVSFILSLLTPIKSVEEIEISFSCNGEIEMVQYEDERRPLLTENVTNREHRTFPWAYMVCAISCLTMVSVEIYVSFAGTKYFVDLAFFQVMQMINLSILMALHVKLLILCTKLKTNGTQQARGANMPQKKIVLLLSCLGHEMYDVFGAFGMLIRSEDATFLATLTTTKHCISLIAAFYQTILILGLKGKHIYKKDLKKLLLLVSFINFAFWLGDCFIMKT